VSGAYRFCPQCGGELVLRETGGLARPTCLADGCGFVLWDNPVPVVAALVELEGRIVLARNDAWPKNSFELVNGFMDRYE